MPYKYDSEKERKVWRLVIKYRKKGLSLAEAIRLVSEELNVSQEDVANITHKYAAIKGY